MMTDVIWPFFGNKIGCSSLYSRFLTGVENMGGKGGLKSVHGGSMGGLKMLLKDTCEGVHLI